MDPIIVLLFFIHKYIFVWEHNRTRIQQHKWSIDLVRLANLIAHDPKESRLISPDAGNLSSHLASTVRMYIYLYAMQRIYRRNRAITKMFA